MQMTFSSKQNGNLWESNVKWEGETPFPEVFILVSYIIPSSELAQAKIVSGEMNIDIEKILSENPTRTNFSNVQDFFIDIPDKPPIHFTTPDSAEVQMILLGDNFHLRIFLTPNGQELPASGTLGWTVGTE